MSGVATAIVGSAIIGTVGSSIAADKAADAQKDATNRQISASQGASDFLWGASQEANQMQYNMWQNMQGVLQPWINVGVGNAQLYEDLRRSGPGQFKDSPLYGAFKSELDAGVEKVQAREAALGRTGTPMETMGIMDYTGDVTNRYYNNFVQNYYRNLENAYKMSALGLGAAGTRTQQGLNLVNSMADIKVRGAGGAAGYMSDVGTAGALGAATQGNIQQNLIGDIASFTGQGLQSLYNQPGTPAPTSNLTGMIPPTSYKPFSYQSDYFGTMGGGGTVGSGTGTGWGGYQSDFFGTMG